MVVARFGPTTEWDGKTITHENGLFALAGHGPIRPRVCSTTTVKGTWRGLMTACANGCSRWPQPAPANSRLRSGSGSPRGHRPPRRRDVFDLLAHQPLHQ